MVVFTGKSLSVQPEFIDETGEKVSCLQMQITLLGTRSEVLTTCKAVTLRGGQRVICVFPTLNILIEATSEQAEKMIKKLKN